MELLSLLSFLPFYHHRSTLHVAFVINAIGKPRAAIGKTPAWMLEINLIVALIRPFNCPSRAHARGWQPRKENDASLAR